MKKPLSRWASSLAASALMLGGVTFAVGGGVAQAVPGVCEDPQSSVTVFGYNDFHGRVENAAIFFTPVEAARAAKGSENILLVNAGDNIGGSTFVSMIQNDIPTLDAMAVADIDGIGTGNHEFDKGWTDLSDRVIPHTHGDDDHTIPYLSANVYDKGTTNVAAPLKPYEIFEKGGLQIAVIGAVTADLPSLVNPAGLGDLDVGDPVEAINRVVGELPDTVDVTIVAIHEGGPDGNKSAVENAAMSPAFASIYYDLDPSIDVIFSGHTHQFYNWKTANGVPLLQAGSYAERMAKVELQKDAAGDFCGTSIEMLKFNYRQPGGDVAGDFPRIHEIQAIIDAAKATASVLGSEVVGFANEPVSTAKAGNSDTRNVESPMSNLVAQMFYDQLGDGDPDFIGIQNPGGTRDSFNRGPVTYEEAALVLPFANSLYTTQLTGAQVKTVLEQQWQENANGTVPSRPYLALGLSDNVTYTFDESRDRLDRITSISVNGEPINMDKLYTVGSGSFLISGGDNFFVFADGVNTRDSGRIDLEAWVDWVKGSDALSPDYSKRGVSAPKVVGSLTEGGAPVEYVFGKPLEGGVQTDTLDMLLNPSGEKVSTPLKNVNISAYIGDEMVGGGTVVDGVGTVHVAIAHGTSLEAGNNLIDFVVEESGTIITLPVTVKLAPAPPVKPVDVYTTPGYHKQNGREWITSCEPYSITERCTTYIYGTDVQMINGQIVKRNGWMFNNLTYKPSPRSAWVKNPLGYAGSWTSAEGRKWMTECDNAQTGPNACRSYIQMKVVESIKKADGSYRYAEATKFVFNSQVLFK